MTVRFLSVDPDAEFDLILSVCGYESRARHILEARSVEGRMKVAVGYGSSEILAFDENKDKFEDAGYLVKSVSELEYETFIESLVRSVRQGADMPARVLIDISCFTRLRLAQTIEALFESGSFELEVFYSLAAFQPPASEDPPNEFLCPVTEYLSGWTGGEDKAVVLVSGLGYEQTMALGIMEHIDPYDLWLFSPVSPIVEYDSAVISSNELLLSTAPVSNILNYPVMQGDVLLAKLLPLVDSLRRDYRCILMPLGPKVFALSCIIVGCIYRDVSVWRASAGVHCSPVDRAASGITSSFKIAYSKGRNDI